MEGKLSSLFRWEGQVVVFSDLDADAVRDLLTQCDAEGLCVEGIHCCTARGDYFQSHTWQSFCPDYLLPLDGWHWKALEQHLLSHESEVLSQDPATPPVFDLELSQDFLSRKSAEGMTALVASLRESPFYQAKDFSRPKNRLRGS